MYEFICNWCRKVKPIPLPTYQSGDQVQFIQPKYNDLAVTEIGTVIIVQRNLLTIERSNGETIKRLNELERVTQIGAPSPLLIAMKGVCECEVSG